MMNLFRENVALAFVGLSGNKARTVLTMLGIIIGVSAVVLLLSLGDFVQTGIRRQFEALRIDQITVFVLPDGTGRYRPLRMNDVQTITDRLVSVSTFRIMPQYEENDTPVLSAGRQLNTNVVGVTTDYPILNNRRIVNGRFITQDDLTNLERVAVLGGSAASRLFGTQNPIGRDVRIAETSYQIIGVLNRPAGDTGTASNNFILIPLSTAQTRLSGEQVPPYQRQVTSVVFQPLSPNANIPYIVTRMNNLLREMRGIEGEEADDFFVLFLGSFLDTFTTIIGAFTAFLGVTAGISLLVGGIGVMNIMLVTVTERTREIGLRKAMGAQSRDIVTQFLVEAIVITVSGGVLGIVAAFTIAFLVTTFTTFDIGIQPVSILLAFGISASIGIFFGIYPARRAARLNPIQALRYE